MDLERWKLFLLVAELGSLSKAAVMLDRPQPVISRQINALERECGGRLFYRTGRGVVPSEIGKAILPRVRALLLEADQLMLDIKAQAGVPVGRVTVGLLPSLARALAPQLSDLVREKFPQVSLHLVESNAGGLSEMISAGRADVALLLREPGGLLPAEEPLMLVPVYLVGPSGDPVTSEGSIEFEKVSGLPLVLAGLPNPFRIFLDQSARKARVNLNVTIEADSLNIQRDLVRNGNVYTMMTHFAIINELESKQFSAARIVRPSLEAQVALATTTQRPSTLAVREIVKHLRLLVKALKLPALAA